MPDQNHNLQGLPSWLLDATYQDLLQPQGQTNGLHAFKSHPMIMEPDVDWRRRKYLNPNTGMNSFMDEAINNGATNSGKNPQLGWNQYIAPDELEMEENMRSLSFPDSRNSAGDYSGIVDKAFPGFQQLLPPPAYEHHYSPFRPSNNNLQQHKHNLPSNSPVQPTNLEYYNPTLVRWNNMQQNQLASPNYDQPFIPTHEMRNNLLQYQYNTPVPLKMNTDILNRHLQLGIMNQRPSPAIDSNWNYY
ncbi:OLC1v1010658C1 [Oldenlandia corymbosa var. corymbosa]|nr:OLC1v1010658C1 [Oldenlandia corymbosa var. corymbosa]